MHNDIDFNKEITGELTTTILITSFDKPTITTMANKRSINLVPNKYSSISDSENEIFLDQKSLDQKLQQINYIFFMENKIFFFVLNN